MVATEHDLVEQAQAGDPKAFEALYRIHRSRIQVIVTKRLPNLDDVDDVVQSTFMRAFMGLGYYRRDAAFSTWLTRIAINTCHNLWRTRQREKKWIDVVDDPQVAAGPEVAGRFPNPEEAIHRRELQAITIGAIHSLPERYRKAVWMRYMKDLSYLDIKRELRVPIGTVKIWLHRARRMLREKLDDPNLGIHN